MSVWTYYNEIDPYCCEWLQNLMSADLLPPGVIDSRPIQQVQPEDLTGFTQCHFFAGIGGWPLALRMAQWPESMPVWTGSCPCQPFSVAGQRRGVADERHLWPDFFRLIALSEPQPPVVFGEQVASSDGRLWLSGVQSDLEILGYDSAASDLCAACVGSPHIRQRLYWVAQSGHQRWKGMFDQFGTGIETNRESQCTTLIGSSSIDRVADNQRSRLEERQSQAGNVRQEQSAIERDRDVSRLVNPSLEQAGIPGRARESRSANTDRLEYTHVASCDERSRSREQPFRNWDSYEVVECFDGKARRVESGVFPLAHGVPARMGKLRAYGNAIVPALAAEFIGAYLDLLP